MVGDLGWLASLSLYDTLLMGDKSWWWRLHFRLLKAYRGWDPGRVLQALPEAERSETFRYGEAPASSVRRALEMCRRHFPQARTLADMGAGRGVMAVTASFMDWEVLAVEYLGEYLTRSVPVTESLHCSVEWVQADFMKMEIPATDILHTAATAYPPEFRAALAQKYEAECRTGQGILTQDWRLEGPRFEVLESLRLPVTWGTADFTLHAVRD